jgi:hypothetical protein
MFKHKSVAIKCKEIVTISTKMEKAIFIAHSKEISCVRCPRLAEFSNNLMPVLLYNTPNYGVFTKNRIKKFAKEYFIKKKSYWILQ